MSTEFQKARASITTLLDAVSERVGYLHGRWQDEREYEDFAEYEKAMRAVVPAGYTLLRATKRPFGFHFRIEAFPHAVFRVRVTSRQVTVEHMSGHLRPAGQAAGA